MTRTLHVVTHRRWVADDLAAAAAARRPRVEVRHSLGLDIPDIEPGDALWAPTEWAARALHDPRTDVADRPPLHLVDPGPLMVPRMTRRVLGRRVHAATLGDYLSSGRGEEPDGAAFVKPANCKIDAFPARWWRRGDLADLAARKDLPADLMLHWTPTRLDIVEEHRVYLLHGKPVTSAPYLWHSPDGNQVAWDHPDYDLDRTHSAAAEAFASTVCAANPGWAAIGSFVLDVALLRPGSPPGMASAGQWVVLETNPAWSSNPYTADPARVIECLLAAATTDPTRWSWRPDPYLISRVTRARPLHR